MVLAGFLMFPCTGGSIVRSCFALMKQNLCFWRGGGGRGGGGKGGGGRGVEGEETEGEGVVILCSV